MSALKYGKYVKKYVKYISLFIAMAAGSIWIVAANAQQAPVIETMASQFAMQAGTIAGAAQACGQSINVYNGRVVEVINILAKTPAERQGALTVYEKSLATTQEAQRRNHPLNCGEVTTSFQSLPLMRADYEQTVMPAMKKMAEGGSTAVSAPAAPASAATTPGKTQVMVTGNNATQK